MIEISALQPVYLGTGDPEIPDIIYFKSIQICISL